MGDPVKILVVEDNKMLGNLIKISLAKKGYEVLFAGDGQQALDLVRQQVPRVVLTDLMMPRMDGLELCKQVRGDPALGKVYLIMMTANAARKDEISKMSDGPHEFFTKPFRANDVIGRIEAILQNG
jgi:DNA-binding response OmpR family regulator